MVDYNPSYTTCFRAAVAFASLSSQDTKTAVLDFDRLFNATSGSLFFSGRVGFSIYLRDNQSYVVRLWAGPGAGQELRLLLEEPVPQHIIALTSVSAPVSSFLTAMVPSSSSSSSASQDAPAWVRWTRPAASSLPPSPKDDDGDAWSWHPPQPALLASSAQLVAAVRRSNLTELVLVGSSRVRTLFYDVILLLDPDATFEAQKTHGNLQHSFPPSLLNLTLLYHFFDCSLDISKGSKVLSSYARSIDALGAFFKNHSLCSHNGNCQHAQQQQQQPLNHSRAHAHAHNHTHAHARRQAVVFSTGICEASLARKAHFHAHLPSLLDYLETECHHPSPRQCQDSALLVKSEESVDPGVRIFDSLNDLRFHLQAVVETNHSRLSFLDSFHLTRAFKVYNDSYDGLHFYSLQRAYVGNRASRTVAALMTDAVLRLFSGGGGSSLLPSSLPSSLALPPPASLRLPHTTVVASTPGDGDLVSLSDKRHKTLYILFNGSKHAVPNWDTFLALRQDWGDVQLLGASDFEAVPLGTPLPPLEP